MVSVGLLVALALAPPLVAQIAVGAAVGIDRSGISGDKPEGTSFSSHTGPMANLVLEIPLTDEVHLMLQPGYEQLGANIAFNVDGQDEPVDSLRLRLDYVSLPVLVKILTSGRRWYVTSGFDLAWLSSAELATKSGSQQTDIKGVLNDFDLAVIFGVGRMFPIGRPRITAEIRYRQSLLNMANNTAGQGPTDLPVRFRSSGFQLLAGILIPLGGER